MDCLEFEELLVDYVEDIMDSEIKNAVELHLNKCPACSSKMIEFRNIRNVFKSNVLPDVSARLIDNLKAEANRQTRKKASLWKKWFYSPVLIPTLSVAIALMVWIDYSHNQKYYPVNPVPSPGAESAGRTVPKLSHDTSKTGIENGNDDSKIKDRMANYTANRNSNTGEVNGVKSSEPGIFKNKSKMVKEGNMPSEELELSARTNPDIKLYDRQNLQSDQYKIDKQFNTEIDKEATSRQAIAGEPIHQSDENENLTIESEATRDKGVTDVNNRIRKFTSPESKSVENRGDNIIDTDESRLKKPEPPQVVTDRRYLDELNNAQVEQKAGNFDKAIKINESVLNSVPEPSDTIKSQIYLSLAQCYEKQEKYPKAIEYYNMLGILEPSQSELVRGKIEELNIRIKSVQ